MIRTLAKQIKQYWGASIVTPIFMIIEVFCEMAIPYLMASIVDEGISKSNLNHIYNIAGLMIIVALVSLMAGVIGGKYGAKASAGFAHNLREEMFGRIQNFSFKEIDKYSTAGLVTRLTTDVTNLQNAYQMILRMFVRSPMSLIVAMIMAFTFSVKIAMIYLVAVIVLAFFLGLIMLLAMKHFKVLFEKYDKMNESVQENVSSIRVVKSFVREDYEKGKFGKASNNIYKLAVAAEKVLSFNNPLMILTTNACILIISWVGAHLVVTSELTTGDLMALLSYCMNILISLMLLSMVFVMITMSSASAKRISEVLSQESSIKNPSEPLTEVPDGSIVFKGVNFKYYDEATTYVLKDVDLSIRSGETIGIVGGTGVGKSTFVNLISRFYDVNDGEVLVGGHNVKDYDIETLRNNVSMVLQKNELFTGTILENLRWGDENATEEECINACKIAQADEFISGFADGYNTHIEQGGTNVSGGQKQRLCIARALLKKPKILILDDSTSAVDTSTDRKIREGMRNERPDMTKIIIAQRISSVMEADRIMVIEDDKVTAFAPHEELLKINETYASLYEAQTSGSRDFDEAALEVKGGES
ncbi:MAG: ABC transporter ATP-binding protein/permease [Clostridiales bacterium]|nr:ABC transporter ATP-binding protein/permease [Clostridiales bacterium]